MRAITTAERLLYIPVWTDRLSLRETCLQGQAKSTKFAKSTKCTKSMKFTKCTKFMKSTKCTKSTKCAKSVQEGWVESRISTTSPSHGEDDVPASGDVHLPYSQLSRMDCTSQILHIAFYS